MIEQARKSPPVYPLLTALERDYNMLAMKPLTATHYKIRRWIGFILLIFVPVIVIEKLADFSRFAISATVLAMIGLVYTLMIADMTIRGKKKAKGAKKRFSRLMHPF